jgi:hypothetical protein
VHNRFDSIKDVSKHLEQLHNEEFQVGFQIGFRLGLMHAVLFAYRARFGAPPADLVTAVEGARDNAELERLLKLVVTRSASEISAALRRPRPVKPSRRTGSRKGTSPGARRRRDNNAAT